MVKVLENRLIDLDVMPDTKPADILAKAEKIADQNPEKAQELRQLAQERASQIQADMSKQTAILGEPVQGEGVGDEGSEGGVKGGPEGIAGRAKAAGEGLVGTVGGLGKGVGDTVGDTIYSLGTGLGSTLGGAAVGLKDTGKVVVGMDDKEQVKQAAAEQGVEIQEKEVDSGEVDEGTGEVKRPKKIELRGAHE